jgi:hypothetical protein
MVQEDVRQINSSQAAEILRPDYHPYPWRRVHFDVQRESPKLHKNVNIASKKILKLGLEIEGADIFN